MDTIDQIEAMKHLEQSFPKTKARSRTISENILGKHQNNILKSPPSSLSNSRSRLHSPSHYPYTLRSPRTITHTNKQQYQASSPINIESSSVSRSSGRPNPNEIFIRHFAHFRLGFHSSFISPSSSITSSYNEHPLDLSQQQQQQQTHQQNIPTLSQSSHQHPTTVPIRIPSSNIPIPPGSLPHLTGIFPMTQSHSLPTYFLPQGNFTYLITNANSNQPVHLIRSVLPTPYSTIAFTPTNAFNESSNKQTEEQLPFKKRRYNVGQQSSAAYSPMDTNHDDDETSNDSMKK